MECIYITKNVILVWKIVKFVGKLINVKNQMMAIIFMMIYLLKNVQMEHIQIISLDAVKYVIHHVKLVMDIHKIIV